jgi:hemolysin III
VPEPSPVRKKPLFRGVSHEIAAFAAAPAAVALVSSARSSRAQLGAITYGTTLFVLFLASALFHRPTWSPRGRLIMGRIDNASIFLLIAGTYTPVCLVLGGMTGTVLLAAAWTVAALGIVLSVAWPLAPKPLMAAIYVLLGWSFILTASGVAAAMGRAALVLLVGGGLVYTTGAVVYALRRPDPCPLVFGYHEIFHLLVIGGAACHFAVISVAVRVLG